MDSDIRKALTERVSVPVAVAGKAFGLGRNSAYAAVKNGELPSVRIGNRIVIPTSWIRRKLGLETEAA